MSTLVEQYQAAVHAMQTGVKALFHKEYPSYAASVPDSGECSPKHLRVGVNSALCESSALLKLLIDKGVITEDEFLAAVTEMLRGDVARYHALLGLPENARLA